MGVIAVRYVKAEDIDPITRAKEGLPQTGIIKVEMSNPNFEVRYKAIGSVFDDLRECFRGTEVPDLSGFSL